MPRVTLKSTRLEDLSLPARVSDLRKAYFQAVPEVCIERAELVTKFSVENGLLTQPRISVLDKARTYRYVLEQRAPVVRCTTGYAAGMKPFQFNNGSPFAGSTTRKFKGVPLYPELMALSLWPELLTIAGRNRNPYHLGEADAEKLNSEVFPPWIDHTILELARKRRPAPEIKLLEQLVFFLVSKPNCISHTIPDFSKVLDIGLRGIMEEAEGRLALSSEPRQNEFYRAVIELLHGLIAHSRNLSRKAEELAGAQVDSTERAELLEIARVMGRVPEFPAETFREALTTVWICWTAIHLENPNVGMSLGRLDQVLYPFYRRDIDEKRIDPETALELLCFFWLKIGDHVPMIPNAGEQLFGGTGSNQAITLGGVDAEGGDAVNDLTYLMLRATELMMLRDPNVNARYFSGINSKGYLRRLCEVNLNTKATPAIHNDRATIKALTAKGESLEQARDYGVTGCVEPSSNGRSYAASAAILLNLPSILELTLFNGRHRHTGLEQIVSLKTGDPATFSTFDQFRAAFAAQAGWMAEKAVTLNNLLGEVHQDFYATPVLSTFFEGPMDKGRDLIEGGAVINSSGVAVIGLADVADSLSAIERVVFQEKAVSFPDFLEALNSNFSGRETLQGRLTNPDKTPKYGNEDPAADCNIRWLTALLDAIFDGQTNYRGGRYRVGYWTMTNHAGFGRLMPAMPNGRRARENFTSGITPVSGVTLYLTQTLNSVAQIPSSQLPNGVALNLKYTPESGDQESMLDRFAASIEGFFEEREGQSDGGMEIQFNITTRATFIDAVAHPENYPELLVRVSGYTAYFRDLNPRMQKEIIDRTEYSLSTGRMVHFVPFPLKEERR
jgi:pyruvate formate-lyase/glycerol dehydratase family glycyl radical enzyme